MRLISCLLLCLTALQLHGEGDRYADLFRCAKLISPDLSPPHLAVPGKSGEYFMLSPRNIIRYACAWPNGSDAEANEAGARPEEVGDYVMSRQHLVPETTSGMKNLVVGCGREREGTQMWTYSVAESTIERGLKTAPTDVDNSEATRALMLGQVQKRLDAAIQFRREFAVHDRKPAISKAAFDACQKVAGLKNLENSQDLPAGPVRKAEGAPAAR